VQTDFSGTWATVLVGTLGAGGPGYFVLDVSKPESFGAANVLLDTSDPANSTTVTNAQVLGNGAITHGGTGYIGNQFNQPVIAMYSGSQPAQLVRINTKNNSTTGDWAVIMGNGYNGANGPALLIQSLTEPGMPLYILPVCASPASCSYAAGGNGLSAPRPVDVDGNGTADIVYAGDLQGNLWKFDISDLDPANWKVVPYGNPAPLQATPMFTALGPTGQPQPITSAPVAVPNPYGKGGFLVAFGTGENLTDADASDAPNPPPNAPLNSVYGLYDAQVITLNQLPSGGSGSQSSTISLTAPPPNSFCAAGGAGSARYACLYGQDPSGTGAISSGTSQTTDTGQQVTASTSSPATESPPIGQPGGGTMMLGWYYDIPETTNGNAAKVLANPFMMDDNTLVFYSVNVASGGDNSNSPVDPSVESCSATTQANSAVTTLNFFNVLTGSPTDDTITIGNLSYTSGTGNRFQISGVSTFLSSGNDSLSIPGAKCSGANCGYITLSPATAPGKAAGWRILR
jgi:type IV pilus assembly protein PilY1